MYIHTARDWDRERDWDQWVPVHDVGIFTLIQDRYRDHYDPSFPHILNLLMHERITEKNDMQKIFQKDLKRVKNTTRQILPVFDASCTVSSCGVNANCKLNVSR